MGVRAQFLFSRNCLFISVTGEELARIAERVGRRQLFRFDCHQARVVFGKKLGAAVIGVRVEGRIEIKIDNRFWEFFGPKAISNYRRSSIPSPDENRSCFEHLKHSPRF